MINRLWNLLFLLLVWCGFSSSLALPNLIAGLFFAMLINWLVIGKNFPFKLNVYQLFILIFYTIWELIRSSLQVSWDIVTPTHRSQPKFIRIPLCCQHMSQISLLANLISLTPGTLTVDFDQKTNELILHVMFGQNPQQIINFVKRKLETKVLQVIRYV